MDDRPGENEHLVTSVVQRQMLAETKARFLEEFCPHGSGEPPVARVADLERWSRSGSVFSLLDRNTTLYPGFQFGDDGQPHRVVGEVLRIFRGQPLWSIALWFVGNNGWLGGSRPADVLDSRPGQVLAAARHAIEPLDV